MSAISPTSVATMTTSPTSTADASLCASGHHAEFSRAASTSSPLSFALDRPAQRSETLRLHGRESREKAFPNVVQRFGIHGVVLLLAATDALQDTAFAQNPKVTRDRGTGGPESRRDLAGSHGLTIAQQRKYLAPRRICDRGERVSIAQRSPATL
jgi:hypothetical protein